MSFLQPFPGVGRDTYGYGNYDPSVCFFGDSERHVILSSTVLVETSFLSFGLGFLCPIRYFAFFAATFVVVLLSDGSE